MNCKLPDISNEIEALILKELGNKTLDNDVLSKLLPLVNGVNALTNDIEGMESILQALPSVIDDKLEVTDTKLEEDDSIDVAGKVVSNIQGIRDIIGDGRLNSMTIPIMNKLLSHAVSKLKREELIKLADGNLNVVDSKLLDDMSELHRETYNMLLEKKAVQNTLTNTYKYIVSNRLETIANRELLTAQALLDTYNKDKLNEYIKLKNDRTKFYEDNREALVKAREAKKSVLDEEGEFQKRYEEVKSKQKELATKFDKFRNTSKVEGARSIIAKAADIL
jgi:hypothetical protein